MPRTIAYGIDPAQVYDVHHPTTAPTGTTVVVVHGGFWRQEWDREHTTPQALGFAAAGYHVAVLEYRRTGMRGGGWPGTFADVSAGIDAVRADPALPDPCIVVGHSAGGHLAALAAARPEAEGLVGVIPLAGNVDLALVRDLHLGDDAAEAFMGDADEEQWGRADPAANPPRVPVVLIHGDADDTVPLRVSESYLERVGTGVELRRMPGAGHFAPIEPDHPTFQLVLDEVASLTRR